MRLITVASEVLRSLTVAARLEIACLSPSRDRQGAIK